jgi:hypothetical protein
MTKPNDPLTAARRAVANARLEEFRRQAWKLAHSVQRGLVDKGRAVDGLFDIAQAHALVAAHGEERVESIVIEAFDGAAFDPWRSEVA